MPYVKRFTKLPRPAFVASPRGRSPNATETWPVDNHLAAGAGNAGWCQVRWPTATRYSWSSAYVPSVAWFVRQVTSRTSAQACSHSPCATSTSRVRRYDPDAVRMKSSCAPHRREAPGDDVTLDRHVDAVLGEAAAQVRRIAPFGAARLVLHTVRGRQVLCVAHDQVEVDPGSARRVACDPEPGVDLIDTGDDRAASCCVQGDQAHPSRRRAPGLPDPTPAASTSRSAAGLRWAAIVGWCPSAHIARDSARRRSSSSASISANTARVSVDPARPAAPPCRGSPPERSHRSVHPRRSTAPLGCARPASSRGNVPPLRSRSNPAGAPALSAPRRPPTAAGAHRRPVQVTTRSGRWRGRHGPGGHPRRRVPERGRRLGALRPPQAGRTAWCSATTPPVRFFQRTAPHPASVIAAASARWSGHAMMLRARYP